LVELTEIWPDGAFERAFDVLPRTPNSDKSRARAFASRRVRVGPAFAEASASAWEAVAGQDGGRAGDAASARKARLRSF